MGEVLIRVHEDNLDTKSQPLLGVGNLESTENLEHSFDLAELGLYLHKAPFIGLGEIRLPASVESRLPLWKAFILFHIRLLAYFWCELSNDLLNETLRWKAFICLDNLEIFSEKAGM